jgi:nucleoside-diphosphate-sugar epimerase
MSELLRSNGAIERYAGVRTVVLGASGFIGRWVARKLCAAGADVVLQVRDARTAADVLDAYGIRAETHEVDLRNAESVRRFLEHSRPAITFNLAGYGVDPAERDEEASRDLNARLVETVCATLSACRTHWSGQTIVHAGTAMEYGSAGGDLAETCSTAPWTNYGRSKLAGTLALERYCRGGELNGLTGRLFSVYGPGETSGRLLPTLIAAASTERGISLTAGLHERDFLYVEDAADALLLLGVSPTTTCEPVNVATGVLSRVRTFVETAATILGIPSRRLDFGALPTRSEEMLHGPVTIERLRALTGWTPPTSIAEGIKKTLSFQGIEPICESF